MYKILLADDEQIVLDALQYMITKSFPEGCELETASSGKEAVRKAESFVPDLVFMDIQMPGLNGIEAVAEIRKNNPETVFIMLTAYDKFDYAKNALNLGVFEYLLKPINRAKITEVLEKAFDKIDSEKAHKNSDREMSEKLQNVIPVLENGFIYTIVFYEDHHKDEAFEYKSLLNIRENGGYIMSIELDDAEDRGDSDNTMGLSAKSVKSVNFYPRLKEIIQSCCKCVVGPMMLNKVVVFVPQSPAAEYVLRVSAIGVAEQIYNYLKEEIDADIRIGIGSFQPSVDKLCQSYDEALKALHYAPLKIVHYKDLPEEQVVKDDYPMALEKSFLEKCKKGDRQSCDDFTAIFDWLVQVHGENPFEVKTKLLELVFMAERTAYSNGAMEYGFSDRKGYLETMVAMGSYPEVHTWCIDKIRTAIFAIANNKENKAGHITMSAKTFIDNNYHRDITLEDVSQAVNLSPYYFSKLFKAETGENFIDYLTRVRITKAKQLLHNRELSIKEICYTIGYSDPNYFSRNFKKIVGVTPTEFRESL